MKREIRNPKSHRPSAANAARTQRRIESYYLLVALLATWELQPEEIQIKNHSYIIRLRAKVRTHRNYLQNRADPHSDII